MIKFIKTRENMPTIIIGIALLLIMANYSNPKQMNSPIEIIVIILFFLAFSIDLYLDIKSRYYSTAILIIVVDVVEIVALIALCYFNFKRIDKSNFELLLEKIKNMSNFGLIMTLMPAIKRILKTQRFEKSINHSNTF